MDIVCLVYGGEENDFVIAARGPFEDDAAADAWAQKQPGSLTWETHELHTGGDTFILECGHRVYLDDAAPTGYCPVHAKEQPVVEIPNTDCVVVDSGNG